MIECVYQTSNSSSIFSCLVAVSRGAAKRPTFHEEVAPLRCSGLKQRCFLVSLVREASPVVNDPLFRYAHAIPLEENGPYLAFFSLFFFFSLGEQESSRDHSSLSLSLSLWIAWRFGVMAFVIGDNVPAPLFRSEQRNNRNIDATVTCCE